MHSPQGVLSQSWYQRISPTQDRNKERRERREGVHSITVNRGEERIDERKIMSEMHGHNMEDGTLVSVIDDRNCAHTHSTKAKPEGCEEVRNCHCKSRGAQCGD